MAVSRYSVASPSPVSESFARFLSNKADEFPVLDIFATEDGAAIAEALRSFHGEWQRARNNEKGEDGLTEAEREKIARDQERALADANKNAAKVESALELVTRVWLAAEAAYLAEQGEAKTRKTA